MPDPSEHPPIPEPFAELLAAARANPEGHLGRLLEPYREMLRQLAGRDLLPDERRVVGSSDFAQDALLNACRGFRDFRGETEAELWRWLRAILRHARHTFRRHHSAAKRGRGPGPAAAPEDLDVADPRQAPADEAAGDREVIEALQEALDRLSDEYRQVVLLHDRDGLSFAEISRCLRLTPDRVRRPPGETGESDLISLAPGP